MDLIISGNQDIIYKIKNMPEELNGELDKQTLENKLLNVLNTVSDKLTAKSASVLGEGNFDEL